MSVIPNLPSNQIRIKQTSKTPEMKLNKILLKNLIHLPFSITVHMFYVNHFQAYPQAHEILSVSR